MSGTFQLSLPNSNTMQQFPDDPLTKRWSSQQVGTRGTREPIFAAIWRFEMQFSTLESSNMKFWESRFIAGGLYNAILPHPITSQLVGFTGVSITDSSFDWNDVERNSWVDGFRVVLGVNLYATGSV